MSRESTRESRRTESADNLYSLNGDSRQQRKSAERETTPERRAGHESERATDKMRAEARGEWFKQHEVARKQPLKLDHDGSYVVQHGDCLSTIAQRRLHKDGERVNHKSIEAEVKRIRDLNSGEHKSLDSSDVRKRDVIRDGWHLKIYENPNDPRAHRSAPESTSKATGRTAPDKAEPPQTRHNERRQADAAPRQAVPPYDGTLPPPRPRREETGAPRHAEATVPRHQAGTAGGADAPPRRVEASPRAPEPMQRYPESPRRAAEPIERSGEPMRRPAEPLQRPSERERYVQPPYDGSLPPQRPRHGDIYDPTRPGEAYRRADGVPQYYPRDGQGYPPPQGYGPRDGAPPIVRDILSIPGRIVDGISSLFNRDVRDRRNFYRSQGDFGGAACSGLAMAMANADWNTGRPPSDYEARHWMDVAGITRNTGYRKTLQGFAADLQRGSADERGHSLQTRVHQYRMGEAGEHAIQDLKRELQQGHTAVVKVINPATGNPHYMYVAGYQPGRGGNDGTFIMGDPGRTARSTAAESHLKEWMRPRDGFVAVWKDSPAPATRVSGSASHRYHERRSGAAG